MMKYGCIGERLSHSYSAELHALIGAYEYDMLELSPMELQSFFSAREFCGVNVTVPYKTSVIPYLDRLDSVAKSIGAVNTVINRGGLLYGYNTDADALKQLLLRICGGEPKVNTAIITGTGGTARTAQYVLNNLRIPRIISVSRSGASGALSYTDCRQERDTELIVKTTPVGMYGFLPDKDASAVSLAPSCFAKLRYACDAVYNPLRTEFVLSAQEAGASAGGGLYMLVSQAVAAAKLFTESKNVTVPDTELLYRKLLTRKCNIVLIGMPGAGKSTLGRHIAKALGKEFYDTDTETEKLTGMSAKEMIEQHGEAAFRKAEQTAIQALSEIRGAVISCGGGAVLSDNNVRSLKRNGKLYYLKRNLSELASDKEHPLTDTPERLRIVYEERRNIYQAAADAVLPLTGKNTDSIILCFKEEWTV